MTRDEYAELMKSAALSAGAKGVMTYLASQSSFFTLPIVNPIVSFIVQTVIRIALEKGEMGAFFFYIDMRTSAQGRAFEQAAIRNREAQQKGTNEEKRIAESNLIQSFRALARFTN